MTSLRSTTPSLTMKYWIGLLCHCMGVLLCCTSLSTVRWCHGYLSLTFVSLGLWQACMEGECVKLSDYNHMLADVLGRGWLTVCQVCSTSAVVILCMGLILSTFFVISMRCRQRLRLLHVLTTMTTVGGMLYAYALVLYVMETRNSLMKNGAPLSFGTSMYIGIGGVCASTVAAVLYVYEYKILNDPRTKYTPLK